jgi:hypothetical protein
MAVRWFEKKDTGSSTCQGMSVYASKRLHVDVYCSFEFEQAAAISVRTCYAFVFVDTYVRSCDAVELSSRQMVSIAPELQAVLRGAARAQELEDGQDWPAAIDVYYRAGCQLSYMLDMHVDKDRDCTLAEVLCGLHSQYQQRISVSTCDQQARCCARSSPASSICNTGASSRY